MHLAPVGSFGLNAVERLLKGLLHVALRTLENCRSIELDASRDGAAGEHRGNLVLGIFAAIVVRATLYQAGHRYKRCVSELWRDELMDSGGWHGMTGELRPKTR
jgi:hypothetical protein